MADVTFPAPGGALPGYLAVPDGDGPWPAVVVVHDAFGMTPDVRRHTDRLAREGYLALAPRLYARGRKPLCVAATFRAMRSGSGPAIDDVRAAGRWLAGRDDCTGRVGVIGFCMGGGFALLLGTTGDFAASAPNYGMLPKDLDVLAQSCPVVASFGGKDRTLRGAAATLETKLTEFGVPHDVKEYPEAAHSFMNDHRGSAFSPLLKVTGSFHEPSAEDAWQRILAFFAAHVRAV